MPDPLFPRRAILALPFLLPAVLAQAQQGVKDYRSWSTRQLLPGLRVGVVTMQTWYGVTDINIAEGQLGGQGISLELAVSLDGPTRSSRLEDLGEALGGAISIVGLEVQPSLAEPAELSGLRYSKGRLYSWPGGDARHLFILPEGNLELRAPVAGGGLLTFDDGTSMTLRSINGSLPQISGEASVYTGTLSSGEPPAATWPGDILVAIIEPRVTNANPHDLFVAGGDGGKERRLRVLGIARRGDFSVKPNQAALLIRQPVPQQVMDRLLTSMPLVVSIDLPAEDRLADTIVPLGEVIMHEGMLQGRFTEPAIVQNALAIDAASRRLVMISPSKRRARGVGVPADKLKQFLEELGYGEAVILPDRFPLLIANMKETDDERDAANAPVRLALAFTNRTSTLTMPERDTNLFRVRGVVLEGTRREFRGNLTRSLRDEKLAIEGDLGQFWATTFETVTDASGQQGSDNPNSIRLVLPKPVRIGALELLHVEAAGFSPEFNVKHFRVLGREKSTALWRELADVNHGAPVPRDRILFPETPLLSELRIQIIEPSFLPGGNVARLSELYLWSTEEGL